MFTILILSFIVACGCSAYAGAHYGSKAGAAVSALEARVKSLEASIKAKL